jgi:hypothetical protein
MASNTKTRPLWNGPFGYFEWELRKTDPQGVTLVQKHSGQSTIGKLKGDQTTVSENHPNWRSAKGGDVGGPFSTSKRVINRSPHKIAVERTYLHPPNPYIKSHVSATVDVACPVEMFGEFPKWPTSQASTESTLNAMGATGISRCRPTSSGVELATALGEIQRDGVPVPVIQSWKRRTSIAKKAAGEFLNAQFGWLPLIDEIKKTGLNAQNSAKILEQYQRDKGQHIRRSYEYPVERTEESEILSTNKTPVGDYASGGTPEPSGMTGGTWSKTTTTMKRRWLSCAFAYGVPKSLPGTKGIMDAAAESDKLFGISLTPDVVWNLAPWTWAIDWVSNTGEVLSTLSDFISHGLVMEYAYIMEHTRHEARYSLSGCTYYGKSADPPDASLIVETKTRVRANPFGFGVNWEGLSSSQAAILAALGITKS